MFKQKSTRTHLYWNTFVRIPAQVASFIISIIVARILMPKDFGIIGIAMMLIGYANMFTNLGFNQAIVQKQIKDKKTLDSIFTIDLAISFFLAVLFWWFAEAIAIFFKTPECKEVIRVMSLVFVITSFQALPSGILWRDMNFTVFALIETSQAILISALTLTLALLGFGYWALAYGQILPLGIIAVVLCIKARWYPFVYYSHRVMKGVYDFGIWSFFGAQLNFLSQHVDKFFVGRLMGPISLGFYDKSKTISGAPYDSILMNINAVMFSSFSKNQESKNELQNHLKKSIALTAIIIYPIYTGLILIAPYFVHSLLGEKWSPMILPFQIILFGFLFKSFCGIAANFNIAVGKYRSHSLRLLASVLIFVIACCMFLPFGLNGIAISFVIFCLFLFISYISLAIAQVGLSWLEISKVLLSGVLPAAIMSLSVFATSHYLLKQYNFLNLILIVIIGGIVYCACLILDPVKSSIEIREIIIRDIKKIIGFIN
jgi:O-antigen/teichoic acid export membrane protein